MAVSRIATPYKYVGVSSDIKPTSGVPAGSTFTERDTGEKYIWDGSEWGRRIYPPKLE